MSYAGIGNPASDTLFVGKISGYEILVCRKKGIDKMLLLIVASLENFYYADKTMFISELLQNWGKIDLFTRPRRFGKSLNMSMLKCFLRLAATRHFFDGLRIMGGRGTV